MNIKELSQSGKLQIAIVVLIVAIITVLANFYKELFVAQSGKFQVLGNLGLVLAIGLVQKWRYVRTVLSAWAFMAVVGVLMWFLLSKSITPVYLLLFFGFTVIFYLTTISNGVKRYLNEN